MKRVLRLHPRDNVATVLETVARGEIVSVRDDEQRELLTLAAMCDIPEGHKLALTGISIETSLCKYGQVISRATSHIQRGEWVHTHNTESLRGRGDQ